MNKRSFVIQYPDGKNKLSVKEMGELLGGEVTAIANYDVFETMEIAEAAIDMSDTPECLEAKKDIDNIILSQANH